MSKINSIAAAFLKELEQGNSFYKEETVAVEAVATFTGLVALKRSALPQFFHGFKPSGRPLFTHALHLAKSFDSMHPSLDEHVERLKLVGEDVVPHPTVWIEGKHRSE
jgi:hypothetical protein